MDSRLAMTCAQNLADPSLTCAEIASSAHEIARIRDSSLGAYRIVICQTSFRQGVQFCTEEVLLNGCTAEAGGSCPPAISRPILRNLESSHALKFLRSGSDLRLWSQPATQPITLPTASRTRIMSGLSFVFAPGRLNMAAAASGACHRGSATARHSSQIAAPYL